MGTWQRIFGGWFAGPPVASPRAMIADAGIEITTPQQLEEALREGQISASGQTVTEAKALRVAAVMACVRLRAGAIANMPIGVKERVDERTRRDRSDHRVWIVLNRRPNVWQKPAQFKRMMEAHVLLRGNAYAVKTLGVGGELVSLTPLHPDRVTVEQLDDLTLRYTWTRKDGRRIIIGQKEMFHLTGLSLDGIRGLSPLSYMREAIGLSIAQDAHGASVFKNGANVSGAFKMPAGRVLQDAQRDSLRAQMREFRTGGARDGSVVILEDGLEFDQMALSSEDAQWLDARKFSRGDIAMFFGVPPHMIGDTDKGTSWGTGLENQSQGFVTYTLEDSLVAWEEAIGADCLDWVANPRLYARFNRNALVRGDLKARWEAHVKALQWGVHSPNDVRELEDENPREGGDIYYPPPNTAGRRNSDSGDAKEPNDD